MATSDLNVPRPSMSDRAIYDTVQKKEDIRLRNELSKGQSFYDLNEITNMQRPDLIENVCKLRKFVGQGDSVKALVKDFNPKQISFNKEDTTPTSSNVSTPSRITRPSTHAPDPADVMSLLAVFMK